MSKRSTFDALEKETITLCGNENYLVSVGTKTENHPKPPENIRNHLKPSATTRNHPQPLIENYPPPPSQPAINSKLHEPVQNSSYSCKNTQILSKLP